MSNHFLPQGVRSTRLARTGLTGIAAGSRLARLRRLASAAAGVIIVGATGLSLLGQPATIGGRSASVGAAAPPARSSSGPMNHHDHAAMAGASATAAGFSLPENIPDFSTDPARPARASVQSGPWSNPSTWQGGQVPTATHVVRILEDHRVTIDDTAAVAYTIVVDGTLAFASRVPTRLKVTNLQVMAGDMGMGTPGVLEVGTAEDPIEADVSAEIVIANTPLGGSVPDTNQYGTGIVVLGKVSMHGSVKTPTFVRLATEPRAGHTTLALSEAVSGWRVGDRLVLPDTRHLKESEVTGGGWVNAVNQWEERTVQAVSADGRTLTLTTPLQYDHLGARDLNGVLDFLPHVGNLTRNVLIRSESATGTRGHLLAIHRAEADLRYAQFKDLGRTTYLPLNSTTNHIGRYPIHMHHLAGPVATPANGYQFTALGNAVDGGSVETRFKWGIAVHGSHYGLIQDNVVYNYNGSAIATEDGSESFNRFDHNFALRGMGQPNDAVSEARMAMGTEGVGFWFRGPNNYVTNNVAANYQNPTAEAAYGFVYQFRYLGNIATPKFKGADTMDAAQTVTKNGNNLPILQFENNEAYGAMQGGFTLWWVSSQDPQPYTGAQDSVIKDLKLWNTYNKTVYMYPAQKVIFDGLKIRGNFVPGVSRCCGNGVFFADYSSKGIVIRNSDIQGMEEGITAPEAGFGPEPNLVVENSYLRNVSNLDVPTNGSVNGCWMNNKLVVATNTQFAARPGSSLDAISMVRDVSNAPECLGKLNEMRVYAYNGNPSDNFQVYHPSSSVVPRPPASCTPVTRPGINGPTCPIAALAPTVPGAVAPGATLSASDVSITSGQSTALTWTTVNATSVSLSQGIGTVAVSGSRSVAPTATTTYVLTATNAAGSTTATTTVTVTAPPAPASGGHTAARANAYDDAWQDGPTGWVENAKAILAGGSGQTAGMVLWIGDSLTRDPALGAWAQHGAGKTPEDQAIVDWMHAGLSPQGVDSIDGFALATPYICAARSFTVGDGLGSWHFMGNGMPADTNPTTARQKLQDCATYPNALNLTTMLAALAKPQFAIPEVNLDGARPGEFPDFERMIDLMIARHIVPIIITYTYRTDPAFNALVDQYNAALVQYARTKRLPLIDLNNEMLLRLPFSQWPGRFLSDGVHYTRGTTQYPATSDPYAAGGDRATHATGAALTYNGYGLKGWLGVQKIKEIKQLVIDSAPPPLTITHTGATNVTSTSATVAWTTNVASDSRVDYGTTPAYGAAAVGATVATTHSLALTGLSPATTYHYRITSRTSGGDTAATGPLTLTTAPPAAPPTVTLGVSPASITAGQSTTLSWSAANAVTVSIDRGVGTVAATGTRSVSPTATTTYTVTATNATGSATATATVTVMPAPVPPTATISVSPASIAAGGAATLSWNTSNATSVSIDQGIGPVAASGSRSVSPATTTTYRVTASSAAGSVTANATVTVTVAAPAPPATPGSTSTPRAIGSQVAGTFADATGHSGQSHLVYAANSGVWWLFTLTSANDSRGGTNHIVKSYRSSGPDLATATWTVAADSPAPSSCTGCFMGSGRALGVAYVNNAPTDVVHAEIAIASDGQSGRTAHIRAVVTATSITWAAWNNYNEPAATWTLPRAVALGVSTGKFIHSGGPTLQQQVDANARRSTNADTGATWSSGFSTVAVLDNSMINASNAMVLAPLASNAMLAVYDNGGGISTCYNCGQTGAPEPTLTNLGYKRSKNNGTWQGVSPGTQAGGDGHVFSTNARIDQNDWALVTRAPGAIAVYRRNAAGTGIDAASYNAGTNGWAPAPAPPPFAAGQAFKSGGGLFGATDGVRTWLFVLNTDAANAVLYTRFDGTTWTPWTTVPGTASGSQVRGFVSGAALVQAGQIGLVWTEGTGPYTVMAFSLPIGSAGIPLPSAVLTAQPASIVAGQSATLTWNVEDATSITIDQGLGTVAASGDRTVTPAVTTTYTLTATNATGSVTTSASVTVTPPADTTPPTVTSVTPGAGATGVPAGTTVTATFSEAMAAATITATTVTLRSAAGTLVPAAVSYDAVTRRASLTPSQALSAFTTYTATVSGGSGGVTDLAGNPLAATYVWSFTTVPAPKAPITIWPATATPAGFETSDTSAVELGMKFKADVPGTVMGVRFYKGVTTTGTHTGTLWSSAGVKLATATFTNETASGWQQVLFSTPVEITADTVYVVSYHTKVGNYAITERFFSSKGTDAPPLHALSNGPAGGNGVYRYGGSAFPTSSYRATNYWVDVVFVPR